MASETVNQKIAAINKKAVVNGDQKSNRVIDVWSDVLTDSERAIFDAQAAIADALKQKFDRVDLLCGELIEYLGWDGYQAFEAGDIDQERAKRLISAVKYTRLSDNMVTLGVDISLAAVPVSKKPKTPLKTAQSIVKNEVKRFEVENG